MGKQQKKLIRQKFREAVFGRDKHKCVTCTTEPAVDAHHITDRNEMPNGGYVPENGISLCGPCHVLAELYHSSGEAAPGFHPNDLYRLISSDKDKAYRKSLTLSRV